MQAFPPFLTVPAARLGWHLTRRAAVFGNLTGTRVIDELEAEHLISSWERLPEAAALNRLTPEYWDEARCIAAVRGSAHG